MPESVFTAEQRDALQEIANLAMGRAAARAFHRAVGAACARREGCRRGRRASDVLVNDADTALYRAKRLGRDRSIAYA